MPYFTHEARRVVVASSECKEYENWNFNIKNQASFHFNYFIYEKKLKA